MSYWPANTETTLKPLKYLVKLNPEVLSEDTDPGFEFDYIDIGSVTLEYGVHHMESTRFEVAPSRARKPVRSGDVIVSTVRTYLKAIARIDAALEGAIVSTGFAVLRPNADVDASYLYRLCQAKTFVSDVEARSTGVSYPAINPSALAAIKVAVPGLADQKSIATFLDRETARIDNLINAKRRQASVLLEREESTFAEVVTARDQRGTKVNSGIDWIGDIPAHWAAPKMVHVARQETGHTPSRKVDEYWVPEECVIPWFSLADVWQIRQAGLIEVSETAERISEIGMANSAARLLPGGTVILSRTASVGFPAILRVPMAVTQDFVGWVCGPRVLPRYLYYVLRSMKPVFRSLMIGSTHQTIYMPDIRSFRMPLPPIEEQAEIAARLDRTTGAFRAAATAIQRSIKLLAERREAVITAAVAGSTTSPAVKATAGELEPLAPQNSSHVSMRTAVAAEIIYRHRTVMRFGRVKLQKLLYLAETHAGIDAIGGSYRREAAGPFDGAMLDAVEAELRQASLYHASGSDGAAVAYRPLALAGQHAAEVLGADRLASLRALIDLVRDLDTRAAEMVATLYAVWNDDLIDGRQVSDDAVVEGVLDDWHPEKRTKFAANDLHHWLAWMKRVGLTPRGEGPRTIATMEADLFAKARAAREGRSQ